MYGLELCGVRHAAGAPCGAVARVVLPQPLCAAHYSTPFPAVHPRLDQGEQVGLGRGTFDASKPGGSVGAKLFILSCFLDLPFLFSPLCLCLRISGPRASGTLARAGPRVAA